MSLPSPVAAGGAPLAVLLGLTAAGCWGVSDLVARFTTRRVGAFRTVLFGQLISLTMLSVYIGTQGGHMPPGHALTPITSALTVVTALLFTGSTMAFYRAVEVGTLTLVAPISASYAAVTASLALMTGERVGLLRGAGLLAAILGVALTSVHEPPTVDGALGVERGMRRPLLSPGVGLAMLSSLGFGIAFYILGSRIVPELGGLVPIWLIRISTVGILGTVAIFLGRTFRLPRGRVWLFIAAGGMLDSLGLLANNIGLGFDQVAVVTTLSSLFATVTVLLAAIFLRERLLRHQWLGVALILAGVVLVTQRAKAEGRKREAGSGMGTQVNVVHPTTHGQGPIVSDPAPMLDAVTHVQHHGLAMPSRIRANPRTSAAPGSPSGAKSIRFRMPS